MPEEYTNRELGILIKTGFEGTHKRLDITNGKIDRHETRITRIEASKNRVLGAFILVNIIFLPIIFILIKKYI